MEIEGGAKALAVPTPSADRLRPFGCRVEVGARQSRVQLLIMTSFCESERHGRFCRVYLGLQEFKAYRDSGRDLTDGFMRVTGFLSFS